MYINMALFLLFSPYVTWILFLALMSLIRAREVGKLSKTAYYLGLPLLAVGYALDIFLNVFLLSLLTLDLPREYTVSAHLSRLLDAGGWRSKIAFWICTNLLDTFDPSGQHCKRSK